MVVDGATVLPDCRGVNTSGYREFAPPPALAPWVECFWLASGARPAFEVLPDGCVDFLFGAVEASDGLLVGAMTRPLPVAATAAADVIAVRFRPGGAHAFVGADLREFTDRTVELDAIGVDLGRLRRAIWQHESAAERLAALRHWLLRRAPPRPDGMLAGLRALVDAPSAFRVEGAAATSGQSRQWFTRRVGVLTGLAPKHLARIARVRRTLAAIGSASLATVAQDHGFSDQAHMARELRALTGHSAGELRRRAGFHSSKTGERPRGRVPA